MKHPYKHFEGTELWETIEKGISDLVANNDIQENTPKEYIVGYLCQILLNRNNSEQQ